MHCHDEFVVLRGTLDSLAGIAEVSPDYVARTIKVDYCPHRLDAADIVAAIKDAGFAVVPASRPRGVEKCESCAIGGFYQTARPRWRETTSIGGMFLVAAVAIWLIQGGTTLLVAVLLAASVAICGAAVLRTAWRSLRRLRFDMNVLMSMAAVGAFVIGEYFEAATAMFLFSVSLWLEAMSMDRARRAVHCLVEVTPVSAHRLENGEDFASSAADDDGEKRPETAEGSETVFDVGRIRDVAPEELAVGDTILLRPGEMAPVDGTVVRGLSSLNQAAITGESLPVEKSAGDELMAGSLNGEGSLWVRVERAAESSTLARIAQLVAKAQASRSPTERFVERFAARYTPLVIALAVLLAFGPPALGALGWAWAADVPPLEWFSRALVLLVIACPCALVISTPVTVVCGLHKAARRGILIKGGEFLETAGRLRAIAFDKTGTLTRGRPELIDIKPAAGRTSEDVLAAAAALESHSEHPLARAIVEAAQNRGLAIEEVSDFTAMRGFGVRGRLRGQVLRVGSPRMFADETHGGEGHEAEVLTDTAALHEEDGSTLAVVADKNSLWGVIRLSDPPRRSATPAVAELKRLGLESIAMLTGDSAAVARRVARQVGIDRFYADLLPEQKVDRVRELSEALSPLAMVGDGVNDAPALAASQLGIALGSGASDTALQTADVAVLSDDPGRVGELIRLGRRCRAIMAQNITLALSIKAIVLIAAALGAATLWMAVAADVGASMLVVANGMRLAGGNAIDRP